MLTDSAVSAHSCDDEHDDDWIAGECGANMAEQRSAALLHQLAENQRSVGAAKSERIRQRYVDRPLVGLVRHKVDGGRDRWIVEVDGRRQHSVTHREQAEYRLDRSGRAEQMTDR